MTTTMQSTSAGSPISGAVRDQSDAVEQQIREASSAIVSFTSKMATAKAAAE